MLWTRWRRVCFICGSQQGCVASFPRDSESRFLFTVLSSLFFSLSLSHTQTNWPKWITMSHHGTEEVLSSWESVERFGKINGEMSGCLFQPCWFGPGVVCQIVLEQIAQQLCIWTVAMTDEYEYSERHRKQTQAENNSELGFVCKTIGPYVFVFYVYFIDIWEWKRDISKKSISDF